MKTSATIDVTVPENRKLEVELPLEVRTRKAKLLVMVEEQPGEVGPIRTVGHSMSEQDLAGPRAWSGWWDRAKKEAKQWVKRS